MMKVLQVIESAYRATQEEQDDTIVWISHAMKGAGADLNVLLRGNAVNYAVDGQDASGLAFSAWKQTQPPNMARDVAGLVDKGVEIYITEEDLAERGLGGAGLVAGVKPVPRAGVPALFAAHDQVWHW
jgi:intracellular sulfur oxidation DsrE/DsrF family protein|tara:strand:- start:472 stop:855 length:384 start_codon:yes stop_codon:yes gene_type:complete